MDMLQIIITLLIFLILVIPFGRYVYTVGNCEKGFGDKFFDKIDNFIYKICKIDKEEMTWKKYIFAILIFNGVMLIVGYIILRIQGINILNPQKINGMGQGLSFNTAVSFMTNTDLQNYCGETGLSNLSQMLVIVLMMFVSAGTGFSACFAFMRGITGRKKTAGNYYVDLTRVITRILLPLSIIAAVFLVSQGVPQTFKASKNVTTIEQKVQSIPVGPVAALESIKHLGTNGGGFFSANSAHPFENPTPLSNLIEILLMMLIPGSLVYAFGMMIKNKKQALTIFCAMFILFLIGLPICYMAEKSGNPVLNHLGISSVMGNMEGKEVRFGTSGSALFTSVTTAFTTGSVNSSFDSMTPLGSIVPMMNMMLNVVFGGKGVGFMNMIMYAILTVFLCGLMVGRTPEFLSKKIDGKEIKLVALAIIIHPFLILMFSALALVLPAGISGISNIGFHGLSQIIYMYTTSAANNGSSFAGLHSNTLFFNVTSGLVMFYGRYLSMIILLAVSGSLAAKKTVPVSTGTFKTDNAMFAVMLIFIVLIIGALTFLPAIALGPVSEHLTLMH